MILRLKRFFEMFLIQRKSFCIVFLFAISQVFAENDNNSYRQIIQFQETIFTLSADSRIDIISNDGEKNTIFKNDDLKLNCLAANDEILILAGNKGVIYYSNNGKEFESAKTETDKNIYSIVYKNGIFLAGSEKGEIQISEDGKIWTNLKTEAAGDIISISANNSIFIGVTNEGEIIQSGNGFNWKVANFNKNYAGFIPYTEFIKILAIENSIIIIGVHDDGSPAILLSTLGNVWNERLPFYYDEEGIIKYLSSKPNDVIFDYENDQFILACNNGELLSLPSCSRCNKYVKVSDKNLQSLVSIKSSLIIVGNDFSIFKYSF
ncbi:MAG: hypothetical protein GXX85_16050 [Ignavibacteria bacterium]|nr:hypothetical protein [Ignavibacteria bacterium]